MMAKTQYFQRLNHDVEKLLKIDSNSDCLAFITQEINEMMQILKNLPPESEFYNIHWQNIIATIQFMLVLQHQN